MLDWLVRILKALLSSLYVLFEGFPALEALRSWFGGAEGQRETAVRALLIMALGGLLGVAAFLVFLWLIRRGSILRRVFPDER
ncbi:MAG: hypothetical protein ACP5VF_08060 [Acidobacteriota bacterium]